MTDAVTYYKRGFEDCAELVESLICESKSFEQAHQNVKRVLASVKEMKIEQLKAELAL